ncbi:NUDIX domain-containing protein [Acidiferrimicrobium sp. IK]|uniref:NUDIX hydrolase n=1 Tax=Acidiferrimicrobium sp. IK TaxID=2871700 RepID=UPI0021CB04D8|nr:NUDIX domain-containing protein [Acidiferrimicrobium sp. IK]MCU4185355.1 NUDIX domain-containing protein [Acidiferrimicrobium sp. IK]
MFLKRRVARVVLLDPDDQVLLIRSSDPIDPRIPGWWELPGGGIHPGEPTEQAALRELHEETGLAAETISGPVWLQHVSFEFAGMRFDQHETVHVARGQGGEYRPAGLEAIEAAAMEGARWWPPHALGGLDRIIPPWLAEQLPAVLAAGFPAEPIDLGHVD